MKSPILSKTTGWIVLVVLVVLDASIDLIFAKGKGLESPVWKPMASMLGISNPLLLTPLVLLLFFACVKIFGFLIGKIDKVPMAEELILTILVIVYGIFDLWLISVYVFGFKIFRSHLQLIPILIAVGIIYGWWAENKLKSRK